VVTALVFANVKPPVKAVDFFRLPPDDGALLSIAVIGAAIAAARGIAVCVDRARAAGATAGDTIWRCQRGRRLADQLVNAL